MYGKEISETFSILMSIFENAEIASPFPLALGVFLLSPNWEREELK